MKGIKTILGALAVASLLGFSFSASAQENNNRDENGNIVRGSYETNRFGDNWFIGLGAGYNAGLYSIDNAAGKGGLATNVNIGKWFTPSVGARVGWRGLTNASRGRDFGTYKQNAAIVDLMWNMSNAFSGYKETRFWDLIPYAGFGGNWVKLFDDSKQWDQEFVINAGILNDFRLGNHVDLFLDLNAMMTKAEQYDAKGVESERYYWPVSATLGLIFNLGRSNFDRHDSIVPVIIPNKHTDAEYDALARRVKQLEDENAALKKQIDDLKNRKPDTVYVNVGGDVDPVTRTYFDINSSKISDREKAHLDFFAENVIKKSASDKVFDVVGSADKATGSAATNDRISLARANAVKDYLVKNCGVDASKLNVSARGGVEDYAKLALNRAVVIK